MSGFLKKFFLWSFATIGSVATIAVAASVIWGGENEKFSPEYWRRVFRYNPYVSRIASVHSQSTIKTNFLTINLNSFSLPSMGQDIKSGGGAILPIEGGIVIAERAGRFFFFDSAADPPILQRLDAKIEINEEAFETYAIANGYEVKPGRNVGYSGLGMRLTDLLLLRDGKRLLASHTYWDKQNDCATLRVQVADFSQSDKGPKIGAWQQIFVSKPCLSLSDNKAKPFAGHQSGGRMAETKDGTVLLTVGDFKNDGEKRDLNVAELSNDYGKIYEINPADGRSELFSRGHRNPQGLAITDDGVIWETEHGPIGGDELNIVQRGHDYGWPFVTLGLDCRRCDWQIEGSHTGFEQPVFSWMPSIGVSNLIVVKDFDPLWKNDLLVASLLGEKLHHLRLDGYKVQYDELLTIGARIRDIAEIDGGKIVLWTDNGALVFMNVDHRKSLSDQLSAGLSAPAYRALNECRACHDFDPGAGRVGKINLWQIMGRARAQQQDVAYSDALKSAGGLWTRENMEKFLENPQEAIPETSMPYGGIADKFTRHQLVNYLLKLHE